VEYLTALTRELERPGKGHLDGYLKPFIREAVGQDRLAAHLAQTRGLDGINEPVGASEVLGRFSDPVVRARYELQQRRRRQGNSNSRESSAATKSKGERNADRAEHKAKPGK
jgi:cell filamentation protein